MEAFGEIGSSERGQIAYRFDLVYVETLTTLEKS